jgi:dephospho-CoA kinase
VIVAGLTGGIATGKSTVAAIFQQAGACLIDADRIARDAVRQGTPAYAEIRAHFGVDILLPGGEIDRQRLAAVIFSNPAEQRVLEGIVHPRVKEETTRQLDRLGRKQPGAIVILDVPLLFESGMGVGLAEIIVVYAPEAVQIRRLMTRDGLTPAEALARIRAQMPIESKKALATIVIDNSGELAHTRAQALEVYRQLAAQRAEGQRA